MRIGLDIDNVISDFDGSLLEEFIKEDKKKRNTGIINENAKHISNGMFDWSKEEVKEFYINHTERIAKDLKVIKDCKKYMDLLLKEGHELYLISNRPSNEYRDAYKTTYDWLKKNNINYTKLIISKSPNKSEECKENGIEIMIDDRVSSCIDMINEGVNCLVKVTKYNKNRLEGLPSVETWQDIYHAIHILNSVNKKINVNK